MSQSSRRPKREFRPGSHATIYLLALLYLAYLLFQLVRNAVQGGENAPEPLHLVLGVAVLGGGIALLGFMAWRMTHLQQPESEPPAAEEKREEAEAPESPEAPGEGLEKLQEENSENTEENPS